ncbi:inositol monophosphatase family protein [Staphylococcus simiae]|uniref:inositol monophosphatase family protein n=1 Tax=Staphylococcus simiae TaxID=308354 RepID=UPI001A96CDDE|nr:inositol monophosphatase family protein [Staphylococcus simiae]MBO1198623.1 inositol monophosphatase family protein [Staphylococcus simiae]MBO1200765.1 inositol monophosphatase family protein [Staphylococcus simiae]MBO1202973.1 inositol monophosphatase family protein [Staphylococcus simiae]MBO1210676.1 inositol monophosphatase family protein [Staphylococcus simiae]MBO1229101.1 inositol monophosphatase family protein [Staphylococcus simiae]
MALYEFAHVLILEAGIKIRQLMEQELTIDTKSNPNDLVTNVDKATEVFINDMIKNTYPDHQVIGEEGHGHDINSYKGVVWVVDPIDGTLNFVHQQQNFAISIGIFVDGQAYAGFVYDVMKDELYHAKVGEGAYCQHQKLKKLENTVLKTSIIGINPNWLTKPVLGPIFKEIVNDSRSARAYGSAALEIIAVATGQLAAYITPRLQPWDFAGGIIILQEVQGTATNLLGEPLLISSPNSVLIANPNVHQEILNDYLYPHFSTLKSLHEHRFNNKK